MMCAVFLFIRTQIYDLNCIFLGRISIHNCHCPTRLAFGTVQSTVGQLRAIFEKLGKGKVLNDNFCIGNPAYSEKVIRYVQAIKHEQSISHVSIKQAKPIFFDKLIKIFNYINIKLDDGTLLLCEKFVLLKDQAFLKLQFFAGDGAADLGKCLVQVIKRLPDNSGFVFIHTVGKTFSYINKNEFCISRLENASFYPVFGIEKYVSLSKQMGITFSDP